MTYEQAIAYWFGRINYELASPKPSDLKLDRMRLFLRELGDPQRNYPIIHVAGTKGKGSTSAMLASVLRCAGYRTGLFTSPHLLRVEERIQVDEAPIAPEELSALLEEIAKAEQALMAHNTGSDSSPVPTFFEVATALGFLYFARRKVDVAVVEVGLGGRFDATNVCNPIVALITSISFDHTQQLGTRLARISMEKAGIIKPGCFAVSGARAPEAREVIRSTAMAKNAPLRQLDSEFGYEYEPGKIDPAAASSPTIRQGRVRIWTNQKKWPAMEVGLLGEHQGANAAVAVAAIEHARQCGLNVSDDDVARGLAGVSWPARMEVLGQAPLVVLDCAHNVASAEALVRTLWESFPPTRRLLIFASSSDKDLAGMMEVLAPHFSAIFFARYTVNPRGVPPEHLASLVPLGPGPSISICPNPAEALSRVRAAALPEDLICITGSVFLAGELRPLLQQ
jgi:dihydrofolate synthase/folylpolyglutamate synthase